MRQHVLDANALHRYLVRGSGFEIVHKVLAESRNARMPLLMSAVNWGEVCYTNTRLFGLDYVQKTLANIPGHLGIAIVDADRQRAQRAAELKAKFGLPYADAFAAELAGTQYVLITADVKDFKCVPRLRLLKLPPKRPN